MSKSNQKREKWQINCCSFFQSQPFRNFISYLKLKDSAGVIGMSNRGVVEDQRVLYCFPPCDFVFDLVRFTSYTNTSQVTRHTDRGGKGGYESHEHISSYKSHEHISSYELQEHISIYRVCHGFRLKSEKIAFLVNILKLQLFFEVAEVVVNIGSSRKQTTKSQFSFSKSVKRSVAFGNYFFFNWRLKFIDL